VVMDTIDNLPTSQLDSLENEETITLATPQINDIDDDEALVDPILLESNGFDKDPIDLAIEDRLKSKLNLKLTRIENEIYLAIKYGDAHKL